MPITYGGHSRIAHNARWHVSLRWFMIAAISIPTLTTQLVEEGWTTDAQLTSIFTLIALASNVLFYFLARVRGAINYYRLLAAIIISFDIILVSILIFARGGLESRSVILYVLPILGAAPIFGSFAVYVASASAIAIYDLQLLLDFFNIVRPQGIHDFALHTSATNVVESITYMSSVLILCALVADYITRRLVVKERQASKNLSGLNEAQHIAKMGSWEWSKKTDSISYSEGFYRLLRIKPDTQLSKEYGLLDFVHPDDKARVKRIIDNAVKHRKPYRYETRLSLTGKPIMFVRSDGAPKFDKAGEVIAMYGTVHDITDFKQLEIARNDFVTIASHQLRTPASSVKQYIGMLLAGYAGTVNERQAKMLQTAYESNERQIIIVNDLLYVAQLDSGNLQMKPETIDIVSLLHSIIEDLTPHYVSLKQNLIFNTRFRHLYCKADPLLLRMVVQNIIDNARKYSQPEQPITISLNNRDNTIRIAITDQGVGIAAEDRKKLFQKFTRIDNALSTIAGGSGLGLYLAYKLVLMHGGKIDVTSKPGRGSTFTVVLPGSIVVQKR